MNKLTISALMLLMVISVLSPSSQAITEERVKFVITDVNPKIIEPGYRGPLNITIKNVGFGEGYRINADVTTDKTSPISFLGETRKFVDFYNAECSDINICNVLNAGDITTFTYDLSIDDDGATGVYYTPITITWRFAGLEKQSTLNFGLEVSGEPHLIISGTSTNPSVIYPDTEFSIPITIENIGSDTAKSVDIRLTLPDGITGKTTSPLGTITKDGTAIANFSLKAAEEITLGHHEIKVEIKYRNSKSSDFKENSDVDLFIQDRGEATLSISGINTSPSKIHSNTDFTLTLTLENTGSQSAKATKLELSIPQEFTGEDSAFLGTIAKNGLASTSFDLKALKTSEPGSYSVSATSTYVDEQGREKISKETFNLFILDRGEVILEISGKSTSPSKLLPGTDFTLSLQLENIGEQDAKSVRIEIDPNNYLTGEFLSFVGEIEKDDIATGVFDLSVEALALPGTRTVNANIIYLDERGVENRAVRDFEIFIGEQSGRSQTTTLALVGVVIVILVYLWRRRKREYTET